MDCLCHLSHGSNSFIQRPNARKPEKTNLLLASKRIHVQTAYNPAIPDVPPRPPMSPEPLYDVQAVPTAFLTILPS